MADWNGLILTDLGRALQAKVEAGKTKLTLTKFKLGNGTITGSQTLEGLTDLVSPKQIIGINTCEPNENGLCTISGVVINLGLKTGYELKELGVFANDPDRGEILYAITIDTHSDYLQPEGGATVVSEEFHLNIAISNTQNVTAVIDMAGLATIGNVNTLINQHNTDEKAHQSMFAPSGYGLGGFATFITNEDIHSDNLKTGFYRGFNVAHMPDNKVWNIINNKYSDGVATQMAMPLQETTPRLYISHINLSQNIDWTRWEKLANFNDIMELDNATVGDISYCQVLKKNHVKANGAILKASEYPRLLNFVIENNLSVSEVDWQAGKQGMYVYNATADTLRVPDLRGTVLRGLDDSKGYDAGRTVGTYQEDMFKNHNHQYKNGEMLEQLLATGNAGRSHLGNGTGSTFNATETNSTGGVETRMKNIALIVQIKY